MYGYLESLPGGSDVENLLKNTRSNSIPSLYFRTPVMVLTLEVCLYLIVSQFVSGRSLVLYVYIVLLEFESRKLKFVRVHMFSVKAMKNRLEFIFNV